MGNEAGDLIIDRGVTGYIVYENTGIGQCGRKWAFDSADSLSEFIAGWADNDKQVIGE